MNLARTSSRIAYTLLLSCLAITAGDQSHQPSLAANVITKADALALAQMIDIQAAKRLYCSRLNCWQKAVTCTQHRQTHMRLLPSELLDNIGQFLGAPSGLLHEIKFVGEGTILIQPTSPNTSLMWETGDYYTMFAEKAPQEYLELNRDKYPHVTCSLQPTQDEKAKYWESMFIRLQGSYRLHYNSTTNTGSLDCVHMSINHLRKVAEIDPLHGGFLARYVALRQLGIPMQTAQRYNRMESDMPRRIKQPKPERTASRMLGVAAQDE